MKRPQQNKALYTNYLNNRKTPKDPSDTKHTIKPPFAINNNRQKPN